MLVLAQTYQANVYSRLKTIPINTTGGLLPYYESERYD
ncbi:hypothetical protein PAECIP111894_05692 [Paenibacillus pseudetheri]|uniref:Uncharacterized protein n=1 Tax=Paenibacillus pseudetheri TaxID=2897682 RepID=A0ABN8FN86_9BACL|nr:hypothetical protein PAECIP111894_05692 [Paenibacillus pseudetheri]